MIGWSHSIDLDVLGGQCWCRCSIRPWHLPLTAELTPLIVVRVILLNGIVGLVAGILYWRRGIEIAMLLPFSANIVLHMILPIILK